MQIRYCGYWFKQLILISVFYIRDKRFVISPKQRISNRRIAIVEAGEHVTELGCCKIVKVKQCFPQEKKLNFSVTFSRWRDKEICNQMFKVYESPSVGTQDTNLELIVTKYKCEMGLNIVASLRSVKAGFRDPEFHQIAVKLRQSRRWSVLRWRLEMFSFKWHIAKNLVISLNKYAKRSRVGIWLY